uniref:Uncharacterized protein n=1 Tax=Nelumbo nucifera TaxID=4432 RepID=A0A822XR14_NELNU|nr:TPA_asm: hypothetical protein HUJ06_024313 [Nelumbo nucifera]
MQAPVDKDDSMEGIGGSVSMFIYLVLQRWQHHRCHTQIFDRGEEMVDTSQSAYHPPDPHRFSRK